MSRPVDPRRDQLWEMQDFAQGRGLEIGPLHRPMARRDEAQVSYADVFSTEELRASYVDDAHVDTDAIPEIDHCLVQDGVSLRLAESVGDTRFDWVIASHVVEHVPDLIGWLDQIAEVTVEDAALVLVVPDRRYTFDVHRPFTTVGQVLHAHELGDTRPSTRAVYDHFRSHVSIPAPHLWAGGAPPAYDERTYSLDRVLELVEQRRDGRYVDAHVWTFTPDSFLEQMQELRRLRRSAWFVEEIRPTRRDDLEFYVRMRRVPAGLATAAEVPGEVTTSQEAPDWLVAQHAATLRIRELRQRLKAAKQRVAAMESSRRWRAGGVVLAPARPLVRALRRRRG